MTTALIVAVLLLGIAGVILWANPRRTVNRLVCSCSIHGAVWLILRTISRAVPADAGLPWYQATVAVGTFMPLHLLFIKEQITGRRGDWKRKAKLLILVLSIAFAILPYTHYYIPASSTPDKPKFGGGFWLYVAGLVSLYAWLMIDAYRELKSVTGVRRIELQVWLGGGGLVCAAILISMAARAMLGDEAPGLEILVPLLFLGFLGLNAFAIASGRVFDARHLLMVGVRKGVVVLLAAAMSFFALWLSSMFLPGLLAWLATAMVGLASAAEGEKMMNKMLQLYPRASEARSKAYEVAMTEVRSDPLEQAFKKLLTGWSQSETAFIAVKVEDSWRSNGAPLAISQDIIDLLRELGWATPERLQRERGSAQRDLLLRQLDTWNLGALVFRTTSTLAIFVGVGIRPSRKPFTYPEVQQLEELAAIILTAFARAQLWSKAQRAEQLATVGVLGASVAHEIRNPLVTIKAFVQLFPTHYADAVFRERFSRLIGSEVGRIERLTEQLLDLAAPKKYAPIPMSLHEIVKISLELVLSKAEEKNTVIHTVLNAQPDVIFTDANAAKQVLLNLCFNAIQAQETQERARWLRIETRPIDKGVELTVSDNGPGIAPEIRSRLFEAFQTTKSSGFGLGLAICSEILSSLDASISVDDYTSGQGATFRVVFPCPPPSS